MKIALSIIMFSVLVAGTSYAFAQTMQGSMPAIDSMKNSSMNGNMSNWGNKTMMNEGAMMASGNIDLSKASPVLGSPNAPVTIIEFGDYQCPKCDAWFKNEEPTIKANYIDTNKTKLYFVDFPYLGADSPVAAQAAHCAGDQNKYWEYHDYLYSNQGAIQSGWANSNNLKSYAITLGLDASKFNSCLDSGKYADSVAYNKDIGSSKGIQGTPAFFIVGSSGSMQEIMGPQPAAIFSSTIDQISTQPVPEFGSIASLILVVALVSIITVSAKTRLRFIPRS
ncbi:thioredoxin domain-containing protein [Candidatus Nitrosotalea okcheonensis]|uniref:DSBA oxidoreductase (Modular protein) n=1 Tax=Candidatus Nitrosotalea okcheonensis TaxID=1903276 RepID=A0A2H1FI02_9ARCH|nr:thioredoxin domain-containing protein [Candidatus Nitrosotalea okcheonensis]MDE1727760.1 thioredoxin domain-containing protein [Nitrososphaerota archaeon]SMH72399.1 DSBA oxidoreductase (modular protein) [Candidatus Nitrosotalea okcheonensis]